jgi:hypothetical protein
LKKTGIFKDNYIKLTEIENLNSFFKIKSDKKISEIKPIGKEMFFEKEKTSENKKKWKKKNIK